MKPLADFLAPWMQNPQAQAYWQQLRSGLVAAEISKAGAEADSVGCAVCGDIGWVTTGGRMANGEWQNPETLACPNPDCPTVATQRRVRYETLCTTAQIPAGYQDMTFAVWQQLAATKGIQGKQDALGAALAFVAAREQQHYFSLDDAAAQLGLPPTGDTMRRNSIVFAGMTGRGKTSLCVSAAQALLAEGEQVVYVRLAQILDAIKERFGDGVATDGYGDSEADVLRTFQNAPVLILDEFGLAQTTDWKRDRVEQLVNARYTHQRPTLFTTNLSQDEMEKGWGLVIAHRVQAMAHFIEVGGVELRRRSRKVTSR